VATKRQAGTPLPALVLKFIQLLTRRRHLPFNICQLCEKLRSFVLIFSELSRHVVNGKPSSLILWCYTDV
jgi:hypothetical protein